MQELLSYSLVHFNMQLDFLIVTSRLINRYHFSCFVTGLSYSISLLILSCWYVKQVMGVWNKDNQNSNHGQIITIESFNITDQNSHNLIHM